MTTLDKSFQVLKVVADRPGGQISALEHATAIPKSTLYRLLRDLGSEGLARQDAAGGWHLGQRMFEMAARTYRTIAPDDAQRAVLVELASTVRLTVHLSVLRDRQLVYVDKLEADTPFKMRSQVGRIQAVHSSAIGKSVLALLDPEQARVVLGTGPLERLTARTIVDPEQVFRGLAQIRRRGWATDDEEDEHGTRAIGAAFTDADGRPLGGLSIVAPTFAVSMADLCTHAEVLCVAAARMADALRAARPSGSVSS